MRGHRQSGVGGGIEKAASVRDRGKLALDQNSGVTVWGSAASWLLPRRVPTEAPSLSSGARSLFTHVFTARPAQGRGLKNKLGKHNFH